MGFFSRLFGAGPSRKPQSSKSTGVNPPAYNRPRQAAFTPSKPTILTAPKFTPPKPKVFNPSTGLPMVGNRRGGVDVAGNTYGGRRK